MQNLWWIMYFRGGCGNSRRALTYYGRIQQHWFQNWYSRVDTTYYSVTERWVNCCWDFQGTLLYFLFFYPLASTLYSCNVIPLLSFEMRLRLKIQWIEVLLPVYICLNVCGSLQSRFPKTMETKWSCIQSHSFNWGNTNTCFEKKKKKETSDLNASL